ncbi:MAG: calcium/sodium antiporter [Eubacterium sp.]|nr:calcium/sodium antiporter [Eubacterium sp.]
MKILLDILILLVGFVALIKGADWFVDGSAAVARRFRVPGVIIGLTIVAMGTSAPELAVSTSAAIQGSNEIAISNVVGSNIFNLLMVLGICAIIHAVPVDKVILKRDYPVNLGITIMLFLFAGLPALLDGRLFSHGMTEDVGNVSRVCGIICLVIFAGYVFFLIRDAKKNKTEEEENDEAPMPSWKCVLFILVGIGLIVGGGEAVVYGAKNIALAAGMSETLVGLTIVALGTSLPELVTSIVAARKGQVDMAVGNCIGSNIFNILLILGVSATIHPIAVKVANIWDLIILIVVSIVTLLFCINKKKITRWEGIVMVLMYLGSMVFAIVR